MARKYLGWEKGVWNKYSERLDIYEGVCWFAREFVVDFLPETPIAVLRFGGINYKCRIFLNGKYIDNHEGGYTEFAVDVSDKIKMEYNLLAGFEGYVAFPTNTSCSDYNVLGDLAKSNNKPFEVQDQGRYTGTEWATLDNDVMSVLIYRNDLKDNVNFPLYWKWRCR